MIRESKKRIYTNNDILKRTPLTLHIRLIYIDNYTTCCSTWLDNKSRYFYFTSVVSLSLGSFFVDN